MAPSTKESAIYTGPPESPGSVPPPPTFHALPAVTIVPAPPLRAKTMERRWAFSLAAGALLVGVGIGLGVGALLFSR